MVKWSQQPAVDWCRDIEYRWELREREMMAGKSEGCSVGFTNFLRKLPRIPNWVCGWCVVSDRYRKLDRLSFFTSIAYNKRRLGRRRRWKDGHVLWEKVPQFTKKIGRKMRKCQCFGETRLKSSRTRIGWTRDGKRDEKLVERESAGKGGMYRGLGRNREREIERVWKRWWSAESR